MTSAAVTGVLRRSCADINMVSAPAIARERGIVVEEVKREGAASDFESLVRITVDAEDMPRDAAGTVFHDGKPRIIEIRAIAIDAAFSRAHALHAQPRQAGLHRPPRHAAGQRRRQHRHLQPRPRDRGGNAICFFAVDAPVSEAVQREIEAIPQVKRVRAVSF